MATFGTDLLGDGAVLDVAAQGACHTVLPCGDGVFVEVEFGDELDEVGEGHTVAQNAADELGIVPVLLLEGAREALDGDLVAVGVEELEVLSLIHI